MAYEEQVAQYYEDGYFIADDAFDPSMLAPLEAAARRAAAKVQVRRGSSKDGRNQHRRTG